MRSAQSVIPPAMTRRTIAAPKDALPGQSIEMDDRGVKFTLFLPTDYLANQSDDVTLAINFHAAIWFAIEEHLRRGLRGPLICFYAGEGSSIYRKPFEDSGRLNRWIEMVEAELRSRFPGTTPKIRSLDITSFSAGYGAVREIVKSPDYLKLIRRVILCDSMYAGHEERNGITRPQDDQIKVWVPLAKAAMRGDKTFVFTHSQVPAPTYANSAECAAALVAAVGLKVTPVAPGSCPAARDQEFPLVSRTDSGGLHVWGYGGTDAMAHMTHPRHMADVWNALDDAEIMASRRWSRTRDGDTLIRPFHSAPYPHRSRLTGFTAQGVTYAYKGHYDDSSVGIFIPKGFRPEAQVSYVVHFHGHLNSVEQVLSQYQLRREMERSGVNAILVAPQGPKDARDSGCGRIEMERGALEALLREITQFLYNQGRVSSTTMGSVALTAHSGGYKALAASVRQGGLAESITDVILFDASYGELQSFADWMKTGTGHRLVTLYTTHLAAANRQLHDLCKAAGVAVGGVEESALSDRAVVERQAWFIPTALPHNDVPHAKGYFSKLLASSALPKRPR